jgi:hypothetical protein
MTPQQEVLDPITSRQIAQPLIRQAVKHFREARRATIQVMADLRTLQNGQVHVLYGYRNFAHWAEDTFEGLAAGNVRQLTRAGAVALELDRRGLIDLDKPEGIGTTALRELSVIAKEFGDDKMVEIFKTAQGMLEPGREVAGTTVKAAMQLLMPPAQEEEVIQVPEALEEEKEDEQDEKYTPKIRELIDRIQDLSWDLPESNEEMREVSEFLEHELKGDSSEKDTKWIESAR